MLRGLKDFINKVIKSMIGFFQSSYSRESDNGPVDIFEARNIVIGNLIPDQYATLSYDFVSSLGYVEQNPIPYAESVTITGTLTEGEVLTATINGLIIPNGQPAGTHIWTWYRATDKQQSAEEVIVGATSHQYTLGALDAGNYLRVKVDVVQTGGVNTTGGSALSYYTDRVTSSTFNPVVNILWENAYISPDLTRFASLGYWINRGALGNTVAEGTAPTYDSGNTALRFTRTSASVGTHVIFPKKSPSMDQPFDIWIRFKTNTLANNQRLISFTSSISVWITSSGAIGISGGLTSTGIIANNTWYKMRIIHDGLSTSIQINNGSLITILSGVVSTSTPATGNGRIGCDGSKNNHYDGWISHVFVKDTPLSTTDRDLMWAWNWNQ